MTLLQQLDSMLVLYKNGVRPRPKTTIAEKLVHLCACICYASKHGYDIRANLVPGHERSTRISYLKLSELEHLAKSIPVGYEEPPSDRFLKFFNLAPLIRRHLSPEEVIEAQKDIDAPIKVRLSHVDMTTKERMGILMGLQFLQDHMPEQFVTEYGTFGRDCVLSIDLS